MARQLGINLSINFTFFLNIDFLIGFGALYAVKI